MNLAKMQQSYINEQLKAGASFFLQRLLEPELLKRLQVMLLKPELIIDCGVSCNLEPLQAHFSQAQVYGAQIYDTDFRGAELLVAPPQPVKAAGRIMAAAMAHLPLAKRSVDLLVANLLLPWCLKPRDLLQEWRRVLKAQGLLLFSCLGLDSFKEWQEIPTLQVIPSVVDAQTVGDVLLELGFVAPVVESEWLSLHYSSQIKMQQEMLASSILAVDSLAAAQLPELPLQLSIEVIYAHAWSPQLATFKTNSQGEVRIALQQL